MTKNRITGAVAALALLAVPAVATAHGSAHGHHHQHHAKKAKPHDVTGAAAGTVASFTGGELTIALASGKSFTATVTRRTVLKCRTVTPAATASRHGGEDGDRHGKGDDHGSSTAPASTTVPPTTVPTTHGHGARCGTDALVAGTQVTSATLKLKDGEVVWKKVELRR